MLSYMIVGLLKIFKCSYQHIYVHVNSGVHLRERLRLGDILSPLFCLFLFYLTFAARPGISVHICAAESRGYFKTGSHFRLNIPLSKLLAALSSFWNVWPVVTQPT